MKPRRTLGMTVPALDNLTDWMTNHGRVLVNISFGTGTSNAAADRNIVNSKANGTTPGTANTEFSITHNLGYIPTTFFGHTNNGGVLYQSTTAWTKTTIYLKCTTVSASYQVVII